jgi:hypothetical protein
MKKSILSLEGVEVLSKKQMKNVGGSIGMTTSTGVGSYCRIVLTYPNGSSEPGGGYFTGNTYRDVSAAAGQECSNAMAEMGASKCTYDCAYDGYGQ